MTDDKCHIKRAISTLRSGSYWGSEDVVEPVKIGGYNRVCDNAIYYHTEHTIAVARAHVNGESIDAINAKWIGKTYGQCIDIICADYSYAKICEGIGKIFDLIRELYQIVAKKTPAIHEIGIVPIPGEMKRNSYDDMRGAFKLLSRVGCELNIMGEFVLDRELPLLPEIPDLVVRNAADIENMFEFAKYAEIKLAKVASVLGQFMQKLQVKIHFISGINAF